MAKQQLLTPNIAVTGDTTGYMNVISTTPGGDVQVVTTGATVNTLSPDQHIVLGDMLVSSGHYKTVPTDLYVDGDISIQKDGNRTIGDDTVEYKGILEIDGLLATTGDIDIDGDLIFTDAPTSGSSSGTSGISGSSGSSGATGAGGSSGTSGTSPASLYYKRQFTNNSTSGSYTAGNRMMGWGFVFTNPTGRNALITMTFYTSGVATDAPITFRYGSGTAPAKNATATGTTFTTMTIPTSNSSTCMSVTYVLDSLTPGTQYWVDAAQTSGSALTLASGTFTALEIL